MSAQIIRLTARETRLKNLVTAHLGSLGFTMGTDGTVSPPSLDKEAYRSFHGMQREEKLQKNSVWLGKNQERLIEWFADGTDIEPSRIEPEVELIHQGSWQSDLFRLASMYWQVPVSDGYGRRMRFLVWDRNNDRLIGLIALGDAVFNQAARDVFVGWNHHRRKEALVNMMDAYVLGAVPPYSNLLGGKLVASLVTTREIASAFEQRYSKSIGLISGRSKQAQLAAVTTTSALGRSSVYNRLRLNGRPVLDSIGYTSGFGHFHLSGHIFDELRRYLQDIGDEYAGGFKFGSGPNWRIRVIKRALVRLRLDPLLVRHGFRREVFFGRLASNAEAFLRGDDLQPNLDGLQSVKERSSAALTRWVVPRAERDSSYLAWKKNDVLAAIHKLDTLDVEWPARGLGA